jgi:hypothetical protein
MWETAFDVTDTTFNCNVNRTRGDSTTQLSVINHFLDKIVLGQPAPDPGDANVTNAISGVGSLGQQVQTCIAANARNPNFLLVDVCKLSGVIAKLQLTLRSSTSLAVEVSSKLPPLPMVSHTIPRRRYLHRVLRVLRRHRL